MGEKGIQVIDRAFDILEILSVEKEGLGVTEIGSRLGLHKSTVHRILGAMAQRGYIEKTGPKGVYKLGLKLVEISSVYLNSVELKTEARPFLSELAWSVKQPAHLAIFDGSDVVYIDKVELVNSMRLYSQIGLRIPVYCTALGKSLLSGFSDSEAASILSKTKFNKFTGHTILNKSEILRQISQVRERGWSLDDEEHEEGVRCIAAPVFDYRGQVAAAISVSGSLLVISPDRDEEIGRMVMETAFNISRRLGFKP